MNEMEAVVSSERNTFNKNAARYIPASTASKICKAMVLVFTFMFLMPLQVHAGAAFITDSIGVLGTVIIAIGGGLGIWGVVNLLEGYGNDNPGANGQSA